MIIVAIYSQRKKKKIKCRLLLKNSAFNDEARYDLYFLFFYVFYVHCLDGTPDWTHTILVVCI